jgi:hypothetical protein
MAGDLAMLGGFDLVVALVSLAAPRFGVDSSHRDNRANS